MNPEDNNPLTNSGIPNLGASPAPADSSDLTSPISTDLSAVSGLDGITTDSAPAENPFAPPTIEEPLVPAAPVPGSIGSVTSVPADVAPAPTNPLSPSPSDPLDTAASSAPAQAPYNPFSQPSATSNEQTTPVAAPTTAPGSASTTPHASSASTATPVASPNPTPTSMPASAPTMAPPVQPTVAPKMKKPAGSNTLTILLAAIAVLGVIAAIVFAVLYFKALDNPKVVYVPSISEDNTDDSMQILTCTKSSDFNYLIGYDHEVIGNVAVVADYTNDKLSSIEFNYDATLDNEGDANVARDNFAASFNTQGVLVGEQAIEGSTMKSTYKLIEGTDLTDSVAQGLIYGEGAVDQDLSISGVEAHYVASGFNCSTE